MNKISIDIVSGFLGAGKTTFLNQLLLPCYKEEKIAILENEFGKTKMDEMLLSQKGVSITSVSGGCICCGFSGTFRDALVRIKEETSISRLIIEPTGLARLKDLLEEIASVELRDLYEISHCISIVDARNFDHRMLISKVFFEDQIRNSACVFLSKTESCSENDLRKVKEELNKVNASAVIVDRCWNDLTGESFKEYYEYGRAGTDQRDLRPDSQTHRKSLLKPAKICESMIIPLEKPVSEEQLRTFVEILLADKEAGTILRAKGIFRDAHQKRMTIDYVPGELIIKETQQTIYDSDQNLCLIGSRMDRDRICSLWQDTADSNRLAELFGGHPGCFLKDI